MVLGRLHTKRITSHTKPFVKSSTLSDKLEMHVQKYTLVSFIQLKIEIMKCPLALIYTKTQSIR